MTAQLCKPKPETATQHVHEPTGKPWVPLENRFYESAVCYLALNADKCSGWLLDNMHPKDFYYDDYRFIFSELVSMKAACKRPTNADDWREWFSQPDCSRRMKHWAPEQPDAIAMLLDIVMKRAIDDSTNPPSRPDAKHAKRYASTLRLLRVCRAVRTVAWQAWNKSIESPLEPEPVMAWIEMSIGQIRTIQPIDSGESAK
jgi:hypothetical protein